MKKEYCIRYSKIAVWILSFALLGRVLLKFCAMASNITSVSLLYQSPNEIRDFASIRLTYCILNGINPYTTEGLYAGNIPQLLLYTGLNPLLVAGTCWLTGVGILRGYYLVNIVYVGLTALHIWMIFKDSISEGKSIGVLFTIVNTLTFFSLYGLPCFNLHTDSIGIYVTSILVLTVYKKKNKTVFLAFLSVLLLLTKQILIVFFFPLLTYYLLTDWKTGVKYLLQCAAWGFVLILMVQWLFPLYWTETIYAQFFTSAEYGNFQDAISNIVAFYTRYLGYFGLIAVSTVTLLILKIRKRSQGNLVSEREHEKRIEPYGFEFYLFLNLAFGTLFLLYFAKCGGDGYKYCQDILALSSFVLAFRLWQKHFISRAFPNDRYGLKQAVSLLIVCLVSVAVYSNFRYTEYTKEDIRELNALDDSISAHEGEKMYLGINSCQYIMSHDSWDDSDIYYNNGQQEYFLHEAFSNQSLIGKLFSGCAVGEAAMKYQQKINQMVSRREFGIITTCQDNLIDRSLLESNYAIKETYRIKTETNGTTACEVWLPKRR